MPDQGPIRSTPQIIRTPSLEPSVKDEESANTPQTARGDRTQHNSPPLKQRGTETADATSNVNPEKTRISSLEKQYIHHYDRKAKLEEKKEVAQQLETIRRFMASPGDFNENCGFEIKFVSTSGKEETLLPPEKGLSPERLKELLVKLGDQVDKFDEAFIKNGRDQVLNKAIENETEQLQEARNKLEQEAPESKALNYLPQKARQYEFTVDLPDWPPTEAKESLVINFNTPGTNPIIEQPRATLKIDTPSLTKEPEPNTLELPGIENIRWLPSDAPLFLPYGYQHQEATATFINGGSGFALPEAAASQFEDSDVIKFQKLHAKLNDRIKDGSSGMIPEKILAKNKITPTCIRQCFCDNTGSMGTTFVHVFVDNKYPSPHSQGNRNNQVMVLWFPKEGLKATPEVAQQASLEVMTAFNKYQEKAFSYNERPSGEKGPSLKKDQDEYAELKKLAETEAITIGPGNRKIKTKDPVAPMAFPIVRAARFCSLPHDALLKQPTTEMDNQALQGFHTALITSQGKSEQSFQGTKLLKTFELPDRLSPPKNNPTPAKADTVTPPGSEIPKSEPLPQGKGEAEFEDELKAELEAEFKALQETQTQEEETLNRRILSLEAFNEESAKTILNGNITQQTGRHFVDKQPPANTAFYSNKFTDKDGDSIFIECHAEGEGPNAGSEHFKQTMKEFENDIHVQLRDYLEDPEHALAKITDADMMNFIYYAFSMNQEALEGVDFNILFEISGNTWLINRGDIQTLCISHHSPVKVTELQVDNRDPKVAANLAKVLFEQDDVNQVQLKMLEKLPAITKLPAAGKEGYYLIQAGTAFSQSIPDLVQIVDNTVKGQEKSQQEAIQQAINNRLSEQQRDQTGIPAPKVYGIFD